MNTPEARILFPGKTVVLEDTNDRTIYVEVYPPGIIHLQQYAASLVSCIGRAAAAAGTDQSTSQDPQFASQLISALSPLVTTDLIGLVARCCHVYLKDRDQPEQTLSLQELPHWYLPPILEAWIEEAFLGPKKLTPWIVAFQAIQAKLAEAGLEWISERASAFLSPQDTVDPTS